MMDIKKFAAGVIAGAAIAAAPLMAFAAPASAATSTADPAAAAASNGRLVQRRPGQFRERLIVRAHLALRWRHALRRVRLLIAGDETIRRPVIFSRPGAWPSGSNAPTHVGLELGGQRICLQQARKQIRVRHPCAEYQVDRHIVIGAGIDRYRVSCAHRTR